MQKKIILIFLYFLFSQVSANNTGYDFSNYDFDTTLDAHKNALRDFQYTVNLKFKEEKNIFNTILEIFSEAELNSEIKNLKIFKNENKKISSVRALNSSVNKSIIEIYKKIKLLGFYNVNVTRNYDFAKSPVLVSLLVNCGKIFKLSVEATYKNCDEDFRKKYESLLKFRAKKLKASIMDIKNLINTAIYDLQQNGYANVKVISKKVKIDYKNNHAVLKIDIEPGKQYYFSDTEIRAFEGIKTEYLLNRIDWNKGDVFNIEKINNTLSTLKNTQIFSEIEIKPVVENAENEKLPILMELKEEKKHLIEFSLLYTGMNNNRLDTGSVFSKGVKSLLTKCVWSKNNVFGNGEKLSGVLEFMPMKHKTNYAFTVNFSKPDFLMKNNEIQYEVSHKKELTNAFFKKVTSISAECFQTLHNGLIINYGILANKTTLEVDDVFWCLYNTNMINYESITLPIGCIIDETNNLLNPTKGYKFTAFLNNNYFLKTKVKYIGSLETSYTKHWSFDDYSKNVISLLLIYKRLITPKNIDDIPLDKRLYAGGINSVRGFAFQMATPVILNTNIPFGGKQLFECKCEYRRKFSRDYGGIVFIDAAKTCNNISEKQNLSIKNNKIFLSIGAGIRYYTDFGPIRIDFAFPIGRRKSIDSKMQFMMSLGQAF